MSANAYIMLGYTLTLGGLLGLGAYSFVLYRRAMFLFNAPSQEDLDPSDEA